jgi:Leucine-rich repeat (LRR) protein
LSGNQIKSLDALKSNIKLEYLDASENSISNLSDLSNLNELKTLNLNGNEINSLKFCSNYLPKSIENLFLSYNAIDDLNEVVDIKIAIVIFQI